VVAAAERFLLRDCWHWVRHNAASHSIAHSAAHAATHAAAHAATHATTHATANTAQAFWASGPLQLRSESGEYVGSRQEGLVLQGASSRMPTADLAASAADLATSDADSPTCARRPLQLRRWIRELAGRLVGGQEGLVLSRAWQGLPWSGMRASWYHLASV